ncbi:hypothetical protein [Anaerosporobacter sp.]|uniref:hypothetical protein n=1 Tax=Anaerosporobacter sp. TaxID=1872529 RepID=UPI00286F41EC|nr:hypothetical protein [Anaerosporobacter sp.]
MTENKSGIEKKVGNTQKKKQSIRLMFILLMVLTMVYVVVWSIKTPSAIEDLNNNIDLPYKFTALMAEYDIDKKWIDLGDEHAIYVETQKRERYGFYGYPDYSSSFKFAYYSTSDSKKALFGFEVGDSMEKADKQLREHGYRCWEIDWDCARYKRGQVDIRVDMQQTKESNNKSGYIRNGVVQGYIIQLERTDKYHKGYYK